MYFHSNYSEILLQICCLITTQFLTFKRISKFPVSVSLTRSIIPILLIIVIIQSCHTFVLTLQNQTMDGNGNNLLSTQEFSRIQEGLDFDELLKELREEICMDNELSTINFHDEFLLRFLYSRQLDIKKTRQSIKAYLVAKKNEPEIFQLPYQITQAFNCNFIGILPDKNPINGETILITRPGSWNPDKFSFEVLTAATAVTLEVASFDFDTQVHGIIDISKFYILVHLYDLLLNF